MISKEKKSAIIAEYGRKPGDTGSPEVQVAILTARITELTEHLKANQKDHSFQTRSVKDGWSETRSLRLLKEDRSGRIPCLIREVRHQKVMNDIRVEKSTLIIYAHQETSFPGRRQQMLWKT